MYIKNIITLLIVVLILISPQFSYLTKERVFKYRSYSEIISILKELSNACSDYIQFSTAQDLFLLDYPGYCDNSNSESCITPIIEMTNFQYESYSKEIIFISGNLHGDEVLGPNILTEFAIEICEMINTQEGLNLYPYIWIDELLKRRRIFFTPMTNSQGYFNNNREEIINNIPIDPNRDFPFNTFISKDINKDEYDECMKTIAARTVNEIFLYSLIVNSLTFHGGATVIGYNWGNNKYINNYKSTEIPDFYATNEIANILKLYSKDKLIKDYSVGDMTYTVYPVENGMEDWAYAGSWEKDSIKKCKSNTYSLYPIEKTDYSLYPNSIRANIYLVETNDNKKPDETTLGSNKNLFEFNNNSSGNIGRNIRMIIAITDLTVPYIIYKDYDYMLNNLAIYIHGCINIESVILYKQDIFLTNNKDNINNIQLNKYKNFTSNFNKNTNLQCYLISGQYSNITNFLSEEDLTNELAIIYSLRVYSDSIWTKQRNPIPNISSQSHLVKLKKEDYFVFNSNFQLFHKNDFFFVILDKKMIFVDCFRCLYNIKLNNINGISIESKNNNEGGKFLNATILYLLKYENNDFPKKITNMKLSITVDSHVVVKSLNNTYINISLITFTYFISNIYGTPLKISKRNNDSLDDNYLEEIYIFTSKNFKGRRIKNKKNYCHIIKNNKISYNLGFSIIKKTNLIYQIDLNEEYNLQSNYTLYINMNNYNHSLNKKNDSTYFLNMTYIKDNEFNEAFYVIGNTLSLFLTNRLIFECILLENELVINDSKTLIINFLIIGIVFIVAIMGILIYLLFKKKFSRKKNIINEINTRYNEEYEVSKLNRELKVIQSPE